MNVIAQFPEMLSRYGEKMLVLTLEHLVMCLIGVLLAIAVGVPLGIIMLRSPRLAVVIQTAAGVLQTIPSIALLLLIMVLFGLGKDTAILALFCYSLMPIIQNTYTGLKTVDPNLIEAGTGMGMTVFQLLMMVQLPLALPVLIAGIRVAMVVSVGIATIASFVGAGGLGDLILRGIATVDDMKILAGAIPAALLAIGADLLLDVVEKKLGVRTHTARM
ncbi:ABC transporter permease [Brevibacillus sp. B_LB10_24]|uniref:ABC transporter permease n=1 Tax=Brevibacillus sp. B_LB10_24 TaxID=3380645 RepID=UPI0038BD4904